MNYTKLLKIGALIVVLAYLSITLTFNYYLYSTIKIKQQNYEMLVKESKKNR